MQESNAPKDFATCSERQHLQLGTLFR